MSKRYCLALDLQNDAEGIAAYEKHHKEIWPEIAQSIQESGILSMQLYRWKTRLFMIMETEDDFSFEKKAEMDEKNPKVQEWESLMWQYQKALPGTLPGEKWQLMELIFDLDS